MSRLQLDLKTIAVVKEVLTPTTPPDSALLVNTTAPFTGAVTRTQGDKNAESLSVADFGAIGDGTYHPISEWIIPAVRGRYANFAALQVDYPFAASLTQSIDYVAIQSAVNTGRAVTTDGHYIITDSILLKAGGSLAGRGEYQYWDKVYTGTIFETYGAGQPKRWTDIDGTDAPMQPLFVFCGDSISLNNITAITPDSDIWDAAYYLPSVRRCKMTDCYADGRWKKAALYLDATWSADNTTLNTLHPYVLASAMNEFRCIGGVLRGHRSVYVAGTDRDPADYGDEGQPLWLWSGGGTSDLNFYDVAFRPLSNLVDTDAACIKLNAAVDNAVGTGQGIFFHNCFYRASTAEYMFDFDKINRVEISGYGEAGSTNLTCRASFTSKSINLVFRGRMIQHEIWMDGVKVLRPDSNNNLTSVNLDGGNHGLPNITVFKSDGAFYTGNLAIGGNYIRPQFHNTGRLGRGQSDPGEPLEKRDNSFERIYVKEVRSGFGNLLRLQGDAGIEFCPTNTTQRAIWTDDSLSIFQNGEDEDFRVSEGGIFARSVNTPVLNADNIDLAISQLSGGAKGYQTEAELIATGAPTPVTQLAYVLNDTDPNKNGLYGWSGSAWAKSPYDPLTQSLMAIEAEESARVAAVAAEQTTRTEQVGLINTTLAKIFGAVRFNGYHDDFGNKYLFAILGAGSKVGFGITNKLKVLWGGNQLVLDRMIGIKDSAGRYALAITPKGKIYAPNLVLPAWVTATLTSLATADSAEQAARIAGDATLTTAQNATASSLTTLAANFSVAVGVHDDAGNKYALALINKTSGRIAWGITRKGESVVSGAKHRGDRMPFVFLDRFNRAAISITKSGKVRIPNLVLPQASVTQIIAALPPFDAAPKTKPLAAAIWAQINHVVGYGQSLSRGATTTTPISTTQPYSNIMLKSGVKLKVYEDGYDVSAFLPLVETVTVADGSNAESPTSGYLNGFSRRVVATGAAAADYVMLGTQSGRGGHSVQMLSEDDRFVNLTAHINAAKALAVAAGKTYAVTAVTWIQGEQDISEETPEAIYLYKMYLLFDRIRQYAFTVGNKFAPWVLIDQTGGHRSYNGHFDIAVAQLRAMRERDEIVMPTPDYCCPHTENNVHLTAEGSWLLGEYFGRALFWTLFLGKKWQPLHPIDVSWTSTHIDIKYHVPVKPIQISTLICTAAENSGFDLWTADGTLISDAISSVSVLSDDTIRVTLNPATTIPSDAAICYGRGRDVLPRASGPINGARGNVMDSHGLYDTAVSPLGNTFALYNVSAMFKHDRLKGF